MSKSFLKKMQRLKSMEAGVVLVEYALLLAIFIASFIYLGNLMYQFAKERAEVSQRGAVIDVPCVNLGDSQYLLGSQAEDRAICSSQ